MEHLISIIMPVYNAAPFLKEAVESILNQSFRDFELIVVDDASTDASLEILLSYDDPRIVVLKNVMNIGNYPSRNKGMSVAKGKYICVMDADDMAMPDRLDVQFRFLETHPDILACGSAYRIMGDNRIHTCLQDYESVRKALLVNNCFLHPSIFFRAEVLNKTGLYDERYVYASDYDFICKMALIGPVVNLSEVLMQYRWHPGQITQAHRKEQKKYANVIRRNYQGQMIKRYLPSDITCHDYELAHSWMGYIVFLYVYAKCMNDHEMEDCADEQLEELLSCINENMAVGLEEGMTGVACGLLFLLRNGYIDGDEDEVMRSIDRFIESRYSSLTVDDFFEGRGGVDFYFSLRRRT